MLLTLFSCATSDILLRQESGEADVLASESFRRNSLETIDKNIEKDGPIILCHKGEYELAHKKFNELFDKNREKASYWGQLGTCHFLQGNLFRAKLYYQAGQAYAKTKKEKSIFFNNFGALANHQENRKVAFTLFQHAIKLNPKNLTARFNLANLYLRYALIDKAINAFQYLIRIAPEDKEVINGLAHAHYLNGDLNKAKFYFDTLPPKFIPRRGITATQAIVIHLLGESEKALIILKNSKNENSNLINTRFDKVEDFIESEIKRVKKEKEAAIEAKERAEKEAREKVEKEAQDKADAKAKAKEEAEAEVKEAAEAKEKAKTEAEAKAKESANKENEEKVEQAK